jgi:hypothetical protein
VPGHYCRPSLTLRHTCCPIYPRHPYLPKGGEGGRERRLNTVCRSTDDPTAQWERVRHPVCIAPLDTRGRISMTDLACRQRCVVTTEGDPICGHRPEYPRVAAQTLLASGHARSRPGRCRLQRC